jgi:hypothetical protein
LEFQEFQNFSQDFLLFLGEEEEGKERKQKQVPLKRGKKKTQNLNTESHEQADEGHQKNDHGGMNRRCATHIDRAQSFGLR